MKASVKIIEEEGLGNLQKKVQDFMNDDGVENIISSNISSHVVDGGGYQVQVYTIMIVYEGEVKDTPDILDLFE